MSETPTTIPAAVEVLVVGAGPAGLTASIALAARGVEYLTVDPAPLAAHTSRAAVVHARTLEVLDALDVAARLLDRGVVVATFTVRDRDRTLVTLDFGGLPTRYPFTLMVPQDVTEQVLAERLAEVGGVVSGGWSLRSLDLVAEPGRVVAELVDGRGEVARVRAAHVVGADGMHSTVREQAGIGFEGAAYPQSFVLADVRLRWGLPADEVQLFLAPAGLVVVAPLPGGHHRVVATVDDAPEHPDRDFVEELLRTRGPGSPRPGLEEVAWSSRFRVHHRLATHYRRDGVFLAGDAAHVHSPAGGQGMNTGIQDAALLGDLLADVIGGADPALLDTYEARRRPVAREVVQLTDRMTRAATLRGLAARGRNVGLDLLGRLPQVRRAVAMNLSELSTRDARLSPAELADRATPDSPRP